MSKSNGEESGERAGLLEGFEGSKRYRPERPAFAGRVKELADEFGSVANLAAAAGLSVGVLRKYMDGQSEPSRDRLIALAWAGHVTVEWLAVGAKPKRQEERMVLEGSPPLDKKVMSDCLAGLELWLRENDVDLAPESKAEAVIAFYEATTDPDLQHLEPQKRLAKVRDLILKGFDIAQK